MRRPSSLEFRPCPRLQYSQLSTPTQPVTPPSFYALILPLCLFDHPLQFWYIGIDARYPLHELAYGLLLLIRVWRKKTHWQWFSFEKIGHQDQSIEGVGEKVGTLQGLECEAEDIVDRDEGTGGVR